MTTHVEIFHIRAFLQDADAHAVEEHVTREMGRSDTQCVNICAAIVYAKPIGSVRVEQSGGVLRKFRHALRKQK